MQYQRGFIGAGVLVAIVAGILIVGGGAYYFYTKNPLTIISPNGGEVVQKGTIQTIRWLYNGSQTNRNTRLFIQKGPDESAQFTQSIASVPTMPGQEQTYEWKVPSDFPDGDDYKIQVDLEKTSNSDRLYFDLSDGSFSVTSNESVAQNKPVSQNKPFTQNKPVTQNNTVSIDQPFCSDSDNGDNLYTKGAVSFSEPTTIKEGQGLRVISAQSVRMASGDEVALGATNSFSVKDDVYYTKSDNSNGSVQVTLPTKLTVRDIHFVGVGDPQNSIEVIQQIDTVDQCIGEVLVENSCVRGINTGHLCVNGCTNGACIK